MRILSFKFYFSVNIFLDSPNVLPFLKSEGVMVSCITGTPLIPVLLSVAHQTIQLTTAGSARRSREVFEKEVTFSVLCLHTEPL